LETQQVKEDGRYDHRTKLKMALAYVTEAGDKNSFLGNLLEV